MNYIPNDEQRIKETTTNDKKNSFPNIINGQSYSTFFFQVVIDHLHTKLV